MKASNLRRCQTSPTTQRMALRRQSLSVIPVDFLHTAHVGSCLGHIGVFATIVATKNSIVTGQFGYGTLVISGAFGGRKNCQRRAASEGIYRPPSTVHRPPPTVHRPPSTAHRPPLAFQCPPSTAHCPPPPHRPPSTVHRPPSTIHRPPSTVHRPPPTVQCLPSTAHRPPPNAHRWVTRPNSARNG